MQQMSSAIKSQYRISRISHNDDTVCNGQQQLQISDRLCRFSLPPEIQFRSWSVSVCLSFGLRTFKTQASLNKTVSAQSDLRFSIAFSDSVVSAISVLLSQDFDLGLETVSRTKIQS